MNIIVGATLSISPFTPGMVWNWMHTVVGLRKLGHSVHFVEEVKPGWLSVGASGRSRYVDSRNRRYFSRIMKHFGLSSSSCQVYNHGEATTGLTFQQLLDVAANADLLINMSGHVRTEAVLEKVGRRVYIDQDPVYTQLWLVAYGADLNLDVHEVKVTVGLNIGTPHSHIPTGDIAWQHTVPPVVPELWRHEVEVNAHAFTTIASWGAYGDLEYEGRWYRSKYEQFERFTSLPKLVGQPLAIRLKYFSDNDPIIERMRASGWLISTAPMGGHPDQYAAFIRQSRAEIGISKGAYVTGRSGWFGDRWAHYLVAGRPVLAQSTGFEDHFPVGHGLLSFRDIDEAAAGIETIDRDYRAHCRAARDFAEEYLSYSVVLPRLLDAATAENRAG